MKKNLDITKPRYSEQIFASPLVLRYIEVPLYIYTNQTWTLCIWPSSPWVPRGTEGCRFNSCRALRLFFVLCPWHRERDHIISHITNRLKLRLEIARARLSDTRDVVKTRSLETGRAGSGKAGREVAGEAISLACSRTLHSSFWTAGTGYPYTNVVNNIWSLLTAVTALS